MPDVGVNRLIARWDSRGIGVEVTEYELLVCYSPVPAAKRGIVDLLAVVACHLDIGLLTRPAITVPIWCLRRFSLIPIKYLCKVIVAKFYLLVLVDTFIWDFQDHCFDWVQRGVGQ